MRNLTRIALTCGVVVGFAATANAQRFYSISTGGSPDNVESWDLSNPAASAFEFTAVGNFNRGMEMDGEDDGWILQTSNALSAPNTRGLYRFINNVPSFVGDPFGMDLSAGGDLTFDETGTGFYAVVGTSFYKIGMDGTGSLLGTLTNPGGAVGTVPGLAIHPTTNELYGYDTTNDALIKINPVALTISVIGSFGFGASAVGAMDFTASGDLVMAVNTGDIFKVDITTGVPTFVGQGPGNISAMAAAIPAPGTVALSAIGLAALRRRR